MKPGKSGIERIVHATRYSMQGLKAAYREEAAFRQELALLITGIIAAAFIARYWMQFVLLIAPLLLLLIVELLNSAIEALVDRVGPEIHELSGRAKDMGSAAVFVTIVLIGLIWLSVLYSNYLR